MKATYRGVLVRVVRVEAHRVYLVWRGCLKRVTRTDPELLLDEALIAGLAGSLVLLAWLVLR